MKQLSHLTIEETLREAAKYHEVSRRQSVGLDDGLKVASWHANVADSLTRAANLVASLTPKKEKKQSTVKGK